MNFWLFKCKLEKEFLSPFCFAWNDSELLQSHDYAHTKIHSWAGDRGLKRENLAWNLSSWVQTISFFIFSSWISTTTSTTMKNMRNIRRLWLWSCYCLWYICLEKCDNLLTFWHFYSTKPRLSRQANNHQRAHFWRRQLKNRKNT